jgi:hypothetical protein
MKSADLEAELSALLELSSAQLGERWTKLTGKSVPRVSRALLHLALAWEIQAKALGGLSRKSSQTLAQLANGRTQTRSTSPGMRLAREWNGVLHVVTVDPEGKVRWNESEWNSLSEVARAITGTRWSGPAFFGLKQKKAA